MSLKIGIVGLPNVGKSTLFKALTKKQIDIANYPFCTIEPNIGVVPVPDARLAALAALSRSTKVIPAIVEFVDIAGLVKGAAEGEGLGNKFLAAICECDAIAEVVRVFEDADVIHVAHKIDPASDITVIEYELMLKDLETVHRRLQGIEKEIKAGKKETVAEKAALETVKKHLEAGEPAAMSGAATSLQLLTEKPIIYVLNASEEQIASGFEPTGALKEKIGSASSIVISSKIEAELSELPDEEQNEFFETLGQKERGLNRLIQTGYRALGLITFFTTGEDETRAWTIPAHSAAPRAGRAIHSDFEEKFIRAEVISYEKLVEAGSYARARELGWLRTEGKEYVVQDGDVVEFKI